MKIYKYMLVLLFVLLLGAGTIATLVKPDQETSVLENRELEKTPSFHFKEFLKGTFQSKYETSLSDQFILRDNWAKMSINLQAAMGKQDVNGVYLGKDGYLLEQSKMKECDESQVKENEEILASFLNDMTKKYGKKHVSCMMIPSKTEVMTEKLPVFATEPEESSVVREIQSKGNEPEEIIDLKQVLQSHQREYIYYRTDHHWTTLGAYYAYTVWCQYKDQTPEKLDDYVKETKYTDFYGTSYNKAQVSVEPDSVELYHGDSEKNVTLDYNDGEKKAESIYFPEAAVQGFNRYNIFFSGNTFRIQIKTKANTGKTLVIVKDSFANCFVPFLLNQFDKIIMVDYRYGKVPIGKVIEETGNVTDVLVMFNTEKFMENTKLAKLGDTRTESTLKEFDMNELLDE